MRFKKIGRLSRNDQLRLGDKWHQFYAAAADVAPAIQSGLPPKRHRVRRCDGKPIGPSEHQEQSAVISWWWHAHKKYNLPHFALFAVPNGGARDFITGARLKAEGVRRGALDLILAKPTKQHNGLFIEMKVGNNRPTEEQTAFVAYLQSVGYRATVHWSSASAIAEIEAYLA